MPGMSFTVTELDHLINYAINSIPYCPSYLYTEHHLMVHMNFNNLALIQYTCTTPLDPISTTHTLRLCLNPYLRFIIDKVYH